MDGGFRRPSRYEIPVWTVVVLADVLNRHSQVIGTVWPLHPPVARVLHHTCTKPSVDLFATCLGVKLPLYYSLVPVSLAVLGVAFSHPWDGLGVDLFPPFALLSRVIPRVRESSRLESSLVAPLWAAKVWFTALILLVTQPSLALSLVGPAALAARRSFGPS